MFIKTKSLYFDTQVNIFLYSLPLELFISNAKYQHNFLYCSRKLIGNNSSSILHC